MRSVLPLAVASALCLASPSIVVAAAPSPEMLQALQTTAKDADVRALYAASGWRLLWTRELAQDLDLALQDGVAHAIDTRRFRPAWDPQADPVARDVALSQAAINYGRALANGVVSPEQLHKIYALPRPQIDVARVVADGLAAGDIRHALASLPPQDNGYRSLSRAYLEARTAMSRPPGPQVPQGPLLKPGMTDGRVPQLAAALAAADALQSATPQSGDAYGPDLVAAVKDLQAQSGLAVDGVVGPDTLQALNAGPALRARKLAVNLERRRWLARSAPQTRIDVNIAAAKLAYIRDGELVWATRVVTGAPGHETPLLQANFSQLVVNPPWYVPSSIAREEILPRGASYLRAHDMYVDHGRVIQRAGPHAALGQVKFDLDDPYAIYLHDTPAKGLFDRIDRHLSHGCVRVEGALSLARRLATASGQAETFETAFNSGNTETISLGHELPVRLLYRTAYVADGEVRFAPDPYGWDEELGAALGFAQKNHGRPRVSALLGP